MSKDRTPTHPQQLDDGRRSQSMLARILEYFSPPVSRQQNRSVGGRLMNAWGQRKAVEQEIAAQNAQARRVEIEAETGRQIERLARQANRIDRIEDIIEEDNNLIDAAVKSSKNKLLEEDNRSIQLKNRAQELRGESKRQSQQNRINGLKLDLEEKKLQRALDEFENPPVKPDPMVRIRELETEIGTITAELSDTSLSEDRKAELRQKRRHRDNELELLRARGDG